MPNHVGNNVIVTGPDEEIERLLVTCFRGRSIAEMENGETDPGFDFQSVIPVDEPENWTSSSLWEQYDFYVSHWGTKWNAYDCVILERQEGCLNFEFITAWNCPDPIYRELGRMFPRLEFDIAATDPGTWAVTIHIRGDSVLFNENADWRAVYARVYKEPLEDASQPDM